LKNSHPALDNSTRPSISLSVSLFLHQLLERALHKCELQQWRGKVQRVWEITALHVQACDSTVEKILLDKGGKERGVGNRYPQSSFPTQKNSSVPQLFVTCLRSQSVTFTVIKERKRDGIFKRIISMLDRKQTPFEFSNNHVFNNIQMSHKKKECNKEMQGYHIYIPTHTFSFFSK